MGCQEMKEKKKEPININEKEKDKNQDKKKKIIEKKDKQKSEPKDKVDKISNEQIKIEQIEEQVSPIKSEKNEMLYSNIESNKKEDKEDEKNENILKIDEGPYIPNYIGKLCFEPLDLFIYDTKKKSFNVQKYRNEDYEGLTSSSSCCNGDNKLFVSGGIDSNEEIIDKLWIFDLANYNMECIPNFVAKNNHSMIYIPNKYIFLVGGNNEKVVYFDINEKILESWSDLNKRRLEPALIQVNNYLYVFDNVNKNENSFELNFEKTDLLSNNPSFELIEPILDENIQGNIIPKFFGVSKESKNSIIFLGGNIFDEQNDENNDIKNYSYDINENKIKFSDVSFVNIYFILPDFYRKCPKVAFYIKSKNRVKIIDYKPDILSNNDELKLFLEKVAILKTYSGIPELKNFYQTKNISIFGYRHYKRIQFKINICCCRRKFICLRVQHKIVVLNHFIRRIYFRRIFQYAPIVNTITQCTRYRIINIYLK